jgi:MFS family permease
MRSVTTPRVFYGWVVVWAAFAVTFVGFGSAYTFSAFVQPLQSEFGASRGSVSLVFSLAGFLYFGLGVVSGPLADRWGPRRLAILGMSLVGFGLMLARRGAQPGGGLCCLRLGRRSRRRLRLCACGRDRPAMVRQTARTRIRPRS